MAAQVTRVRTCLAEATEPVLVMVRREEARRRTIDELVREIEEGRRDDV